jgi:hypothetical protein
MDTPTQTSDPYLNFTLLSQAICNCKGLTWAEKENLTDLMLKSANESFLNGYAACKQDQHISTGD